MELTLPAFSSFLSAGIFLVSIVYIVSGVDDLFIDLIAWLRKIKPKKIESDELIGMMSSPEKNIAIMIPAWDESNIIESMIVGNLSHIEYQNFHIFVGCYPNDPSTVDVVKKLSITYPNVHAVVNRMPGPSSKGQILNEVLRKIFIYEKENKISFQAIHMQDAEDIIHPLALKLVNHELNTFDFIQIPVFSLVVKKHQLVAGTYIDEFAEHHCKDILVRRELKASIPSAGVGTTLSRPLIKLIQSYFKNVFNEDCLTEDYELGMRAFKGMNNSTFSCCYFLDENGSPEFIATREYFPKSFLRSVRQKTRWTIGIALQGPRFIGWFGSFWNRYFLYRDRKGLVTNPFLLFGYCFFIFMLFSDNSWNALIHLFSLQTMQILIFTNMILMANRIVQRMIAVGRIYPVWVAVLSPARWPVGSVINGFAAINATFQFLKSLLTRSKIKWAKTTHELPIAFGKRSWAVEGESK